MDKIGVTVYVIDNERIERERKLVQLLKKEFNYDCINLLKISYDNIRYPCIIFTHANDIDKRKSSLGKKIKEVMKEVSIYNTLLIMYAGTGEDRVVKVLQDLEIEINENVCIISRPIDQNDALKQAELAIIWKEIENKNGKVGFRNHNCLRLRTITYIAAISILCQGYLVSHFPRPSDNLPESIKSALDIIGWTKFAETDEGKAFAQIVVKKKGVTVEPECWQKVFENTIKGKEQSPKSLFRKKLDEELGNIELPEEIARLVDAIFGMQPIEDAELVAIAYLKLVERLKGTA